MANAEDPLEGYGGLSIFSRTFSSFPNPPPPYDPHDLLSTHNFLKSLPVQNPEKLMKEAKQILDTSSQLPVAEMVNDEAPTKEKTDVVAEKPLASPRVRRPGLGRKRARFSLLPSSTQPMVNLEPSLDIDKLKDPEEFFMAFERLENAKREIAKQTGRVSTVPNQYSTSMAPRPRRPGIPGRSRSVKYQHLYPTTSSQEIFEEDVLSSSNQGLQQETAYPDVASQENELENVVALQREPENIASEASELAAEGMLAKEQGSVLKPENNYGKLLDELLAQDYDGLDGDGAITLLQDRLQIKSLDIEKLNLPELQVAQSFHLKASEENLQKPRNALSDIHNLLKGTRSKTSLKQKIVENSVPSFGSPTPPKSPLASLSLLKKHILQSNPSNDPFSFNDIESPASNASPIENIKRTSDQVDVQKDMSNSGKLKSLVSEEQETSVGNVSSPKMAIEDCTNPSNKPTNDNLTGLGSSTAVGPSESSAVLQHKNDNMENGVTDKNLSRHDADATMKTNGPNNTQDVVEDTMQESGASAQPNANMDNLVKETLIDIQSGILNQFEQSSHTVVEDHAMDGCLETQDIAPEKTQDNAPEQTHDTAPELHNKKIKEPSVISMTGQTKAKLHPRKERATSGRQSLAGAGTSFETGVRRSTRIKSRPLEFWKGERFLYGRIHETMATVIGIKYESPGKDNGRGGMKVKSFVSDKYKDLVNLAALH